MADSGRRRWSLSGQKRAREAGRRHLFGSGIAPQRRPGGTADHDGDGSRTALGSADKAAACRSRAEGRANTAWRQGKSPLAV